MSGNNALTPAEAIAVPDGSPPLRPPIHRCSLWCPSMTESSSAPDIEITSEMLAAGAAEFIGGDTRFFSPEEIVERIYRRMATLRPTYRGLEPSP